MRSAMTAEQRELNHENDHEHIIPEGEGEKGHWAIG